MEENAFFGLSRGLVSLRDLQALRIFGTPEFHTNFFRYHNLTIDHRNVIDSVADWELLGQAIMCMSHLQEIFLGGEP
jgi:hypothetical protein